MNPRLRYIPFPSLFVHASLFLVIVIYYYISFLFFSFFLFFFSFCMLIHPFSRFDILSLGWSQAHFCLSFYEWGGSYYCQHTYGGLLLMERMSWLRPWLSPLLLLPRKLLPKLQSLHLSLFPLRRVPKLKRLLLGNPPLFLPRSLLLKRESLLWGCPRPRAPLLLLLL